MGNVLKASVGWQMFGRVSVTATPSNQFRVGPGKSNCSRKKIELHLLECPLTDRPETIVRKYNQKRLILPTDTLVNGNILKFNVWTPLILGNVLNVFLGKGTMGKERRILYHRIDQKGLIHLRTQIKLPSTWVYSDCQKD